MAHPAEGVAATGGVNADAVAAGGGVASLGRSVEDYRRKSTSVLREALHIFVDLN